MVKHMLHLDRIFHAFSDATRREILLRIYSSKNLTVTEIASAYRMSLPAISKHLRVLEDAGLIKRIKKGKTYTFTFNQSPLLTISTYLSLFYPSNTKKPVKQ